MEVDGGGAGGEAPDGDPVLVAAELGDVPLDPSEGGHLVQHAVVPGQCCLARTQKPCVKVWLKNGHTHTHTPKYTCTQNAHIHTHTHLCINIYN